MDQQLVSEEAFSSLVKQYVDVERGDCGPLVGSPYHVSTKRTLKFPSSENLSTILALYLHRQHLEFRPTGAFRSRVASHHAAPASDERCPLPNRHPSARTKQKEWRAMDKARRAEEDVVLEPSTGERAQVHDVYRRPGRREGSSNTRSDPRGHSRCRGTRRASSSIMGTNVAQDEGLRIPRKLQHAPIRPPSAWPSGPSLVYCCRHPFASGEPGSTSTTGQRHPDLHHFAAFTSLPQGPMPFYLQKHNLRPCRSLSRIRVQAAPMLVTSLRHDKDEVESFLCSLSSFLAGDQWIARIGRRGPAEALFVKTKLHTGEHNAPARPSALAMEVVGTRHQGLSLALVVHG
ncbi:hypothetical protein VTK73DRAFT_8212 [Phialemonium thermophilum]|uniref:Uncharacterized protein n=1 Tax=Phialemonium thermophilum TaxID=223376 RepID=A0ABR3W9P3_9PEZI